MKLLSTVRNVALYSVVGCSATAVEWILFFILNQKFGLPYAPATVIATIFSGFTNWAVGRFLMFRSTGSAPKEIGKIYLASLIGMCYNLGLMWVMVDGLGLHAMLAKVIATLLVFFWNYTISTRVIYKGKLKHRIGERETASEMSPVPETPSAPETAPAPETAEQQP